LRRHGHIARRSSNNKNKNNEKANEKLPGKKVREIKGTNDRSIKEHPVYIKAQIGRRETVCLVDTGSEKCVLPRRLIDEARLEPADCMLFAANGTTINVVGEITLSVQVGDLTIPTRFAISNNVTEPMLGVNWLRSNRIIWDFAKDTLIVNGEVFSLMTEDPESSYKKGKLLEEKARRLEMEVRRAGWIKTV